MDDCARCHAPSIYLEHLSDGWIFCAACAHCYQVDAEGHVIALAETGHAPERKRVEKDVSGHIIDCGE